MSIQRYLLIALALLWVSCNKNNDDKAVISIGAIYPFEADAYVNGVSMSAALDEAEEYLNTTNKNARVQFVKLDNDQNDVQTLACMEQLEEKDISYVVAALSSHDLNAAKTFADANNMYIVNNTSTAPSLAVADNIFRIVPDDRVTASAIVKVMNAAGVKKVITIYRNDEWANNLKAEMESNFTNYQIDPVASYSYDCRFDGIEFETIINQLSQLLSSMSVSAFTDEIAINMLSFSEGIDILETAKDVANLSKVRWFGSDGLTFNPGVLSESVVADFMIATKFLSPLVAELETDSYTTVKGNIEKKSGVTSCSFDMLMYDAAVLSGLTAIDIMGSNTDFGTAFKQKVEQGNMVCGAFGLNTAGDRISAQYDFWEIVKEANNYKWNKSISGIQP